MASIESQFLWTDGHSDIRDVDSSATEVTIVGDDSREHFFTRGGSGESPVFVEESREWRRFHRNGRCAMVCQHADVNPGQYSAGAPLRGTPGGFETGIASFLEAKRIADESTGCAQPCQCPPWPD